MNKKLDVGMEGATPSKHLNSVFSETDSEFLHININIDNKKFNIAFDKALMLGKTPDGDFAESDLDEQISNGAYIRASVLAVAEIAHHRRLNLELEYKIWYAKVSEEARKTLIDNKIDLKAKKDLPASWQGKSTEKEVEDLICTSPAYAETYKNYQLKINELLHYEKLLFGFEKIMEQRANDLRKLADRHMKNSFKDSY